MDPFSTDVPGVDQQTNDALKRIVQTLRLIIGAMIIGVFVYGTIIMVVFSPARAGAGGPPPQGVQLSPFVVLPMIVPMIAAFFLLPSYLFKTARRRVINGSWQSVTPRKSPPGEISRNPTEFLAQNYLTSSIIQAALCEGSVFLLFMWGRLTDAPWLWGIAVVMVGLLISRFPSVPRLVSWIERQESLIFEERQLAD